MKKIFSILFALVLLLSFSLVMAVPVGANGTTPTIDGVIEEDEWDAYHLGTSVTGWAGGMSVDVYGFADDTYLYAAYVADTSQTGWSVACGLCVNCNFYYKTPQSAEWPEEGYTLLATGGYPDYVCQTDGSDLQGKGSFVANGVDIAYTDMYVECNNIAELKIPLSLLTYAGTDGQVQISGQYWQYDWATPYLVVLPPPTKADILKDTGVPGKGLDKAPGLQKPFNPNSKAGDHAGKPVEATDVELVKKVTLKGPPPWAGGGQGKKKEEGPVATGSLGPLATGDRFAVVVGIAEYPGDENDLNYTDDDAIEMATALTQVYDFTDVTLLLNLDATHDAILSAIEGMRDRALSSDDEVVFFFSGHGMRGHAADGDKEGMDEAIAAHDGINIVPIWDGELAAAFSGFATSRIICIFDSCLAGGMKKDLDEPGRLIAMASTERGYAYEADSWENGEFSYYFVDIGTLQGLANIHDYDNDGNIREAKQVTVEEAFDYAKANCDYDKPTIGDNFENDLLP